MLCCHGLEYILKTIYSSVSTNSLFPTLQCALKGVLVLLVQFQLSFDIVGRERRPSGGKTLPASASKRKAGVMAQRTLRQGSDVEEALTDALVNGYPR